MGRGVHYICTTESVIVQKVKQDGADYRWKRSVVETRNSPHVDSTSGVDVFLVSQCVYTMHVRKKQVVENSMFY